MFEIIVRRNAGWLVFSVLAAVVLFELPTDWWRDAYGVIAAVVSMVIGTLGVYMYLTRVRVRVVQYYWFVLGSEFVPIRLRNERY